MVASRQILPGLALGSLILAGMEGSSVRGEDLSRHSGQQLYRTYCASCHGMEGHGDGPVASSLTVEVPDLTQLAHRHGGSFPAEQVRRIIDGRATIPPHGARDMPVWGHAFRAAGANGPPNARQADAAVDLLVRYLNLIQTK